MKSKQAAKICVDTAMTLGLLFLMGYHLWGDTAHEWVGAGMFALFIFHHVLNWNWWAGICKGRYTALRVMLTVIDLLTLAAMLGQRSCFIWTTCRSWGRLSSSPTLRPNC